MPSPTIAEAVNASGTRAVTVDFHCHVVAPAAEKLVAGRPEKQAEPDMARKAMGAESAEINFIQIKDLGAKLTNVPERLRLMDAMQVDIQVLSPSPSQYYYWADYDLARDLVSVQNENIAELCAQHPERFFGLGNVALQHPDLAAEQLEHAVKKLGMRGVEVSTFIGGKELADEAFVKFWAKAEELQCILFIHPWGTSLGERVNQHYLANTIGQPIETTLALSHLIFGGTLDRYPGVKICAAHGGGYLPSYLGRSEHAFKNRADASKMLRSPADYLKQMYFDTLLYTPEALRHLIAEVGISQVVVGTDYPFDMGDYDPVGLVHSIPGLTDSERRAILGGNALRLLQAT